MSQDNTTPIPSVHGKEVVNTSTDFSRLNISSPYSSHHSNHPEISDSVIYSTTANEVWKDLHERFSQCNAPRIFEIQRDMAYFRQEQLSVSTYYTRLKGLLDELSSYSDAVHETQHDQQKLMQFLMGLNDSYSGIRGQILLMNPLPSIRQAYSSISQEEKQRLLSSTHIANGSGSSAAMAVQSNPSTGTRRNDRPHGSLNFRSSSPDTFSGGRRTEVFNGNFGGGRRPDNFNGGRRFNEEKRRSVFNKGRPHCAHWAQTCFELHGYPAAHQRQKSTGPNRFNRLAANQIAEGFSSENNSNSVNGFLEEQIKQLLSLLDHKNERSSSQANIVTKPGSGYEDDDWFG